MAFARRFEQRRPDAKATALERQQVDAADDDVAAHVLAGDALAAEVAGDGGEALGLDQRQLARAAGIAVAVADEAAARFQQRDRLAAHRLAARRPGADPDDDARANGRRDQVGERGGGMKRHGTTNGAIAAEAPRGVRFR